MNRRGLAYLTLALLVLIAGAVHIADASVEAYLTCGADADGGYQLLDSPGLWTLAQLGCSDVTDNPLPPETAAVVFYELPPGAEQGPDTWYVIHLHANVEVSEASGEGFAILSAAANENAAAQIKYKVEHVDGMTQIGWSSVDAINGGREGQSSSRNVEVDFTNYLPIRGVSGGPNALVIALETFEDIRIDSFRIFPDSAIEVTDRAPAALDLSVTVPTERVAPGDLFTLHYVLTNQGDQPAQDVTVGVKYPEDKVALRSETRHLYALVEDKIEGAFTFQAPSAGDFPIVIGVESPNGRPAVEILAKVGTRTPESGWVMPVTWTALASVMLASVLFVFLRKTILKG